MYRYWEEVGVMPRRKIVNPEEFMRISICAANGLSPEVGCPAQ